MFDEALGILEVAAGELVGHAQERLVLGESVRVVGRVEDVPAADDSLR